MIPESFSNASQIRVFEIILNNFHGQVPAVFGNLPNLERLGLGHNNLGNYSSNSLDFIAPLTNCSQLKWLTFSFNKFGGMVPHSISNLSTQLTYLFFEENRICGKIPAILGNFVNLIILSMWGNLFTGAIPTSLGKLQNLKVLYLDKNNISGKIPSSIGNLTELFDLKLGYNRLEGSIPLVIARLQNLQSFYLPNNKLSGAIPKEVLSLSSYLELDLSKKLIHWYLT